MTLDFRAYPGDREEPDIRAGRFDLARTGTFKYRNVQCLRRLSARPTRSAVSASATVLTLHRRWTRGNRGHFAAGDKACADGHARCFRLDVYNRPRTGESSAGGRRRMHRSILATPHQPCTAISCNGRTPRRHRGPFAESQPPPVSKSCGLRLAPELARDPAISHNCSYR